jgi:hypothetical protein
MELYQVQWVGEMVFGGLLELAGFFAGLHEVDWIKPQPPGKGY